LLFVKAHPGQRPVATIGFYRALEPLATIGKAKQLQLITPDLRVITALIDPNAIILFSIILETLTFSK
jgi:hypothetical protein